MVIEHSDRDLNASSFTSAWDLRYQPRFRFGLPPLDKLIGEGIPMGSLTLIQGDLPSAILRSLVTKLTVGLLLANDVDIAFVDVVNLFPYYEISLEVRKRGYDPLVMLNRIQLARAFNYHQITEIFTNRLPQLIAEYPSIRIVLVPQISSLHLSKEALQYLGYDRLTATTSLLDLTQAMGKLKSLTLQHNLLVIMTAASAPHSNQKPLGGTFLAHSSNQIIRVTTTSNEGEKGYKLIFTLQQDPARPVTQVKLSSRTKNRDKRRIPLTKFW